MDFYQFLDQFMRLYTDQDYQSLLRLVEGQNLDSGCHASMIQVYKVVALCLNGNAPAALKALQEAMEAGHWVHEGALARDPDFALIRDLPEFSAILEVCGRRRAEAIQHIHPEMLCLEPTGFAPPWPVLIPLHGNPNNQEDCLQYWSSAVKLGWLVAIPQSSQLSWCSNHYVWTQVDKSVEDVTAQFEKLSSQFPIDPKRVVVGGFSAGGTIALHLTLSPRFPFQAAIILEGWLEKDEPVIPLPQINPSILSPKNVYLLSSSNTPEFHEYSQRMASLLSEKQIAIEQIEIGNQYHRYPENFDALLEQILKRH